MGEDTLDDAAIAGCLDDLELVVGRHGDVEQLDGFVVQQLIDGVVHGGDAVLFSAFGGVVSGARGDGDRVKASLAVGHKVTVVHDEAATDAADAPVLALGQRGVNVQVHLFKF